MAKFEDTNSEEMINLKVFCISKRILSIIFIGLVKIPQDETKLPLRAPKLRVEIGDQLET